MSDKTTEAIARIERLARTMVGQENSRGDLIALAREILAAARGAAEGRSLPDGQRVSIVFEQCFEILQDVVGRTARGKALSDG